MPHGSVPHSHYFRYKTPWLTWRYGLFFLGFPPETSRVPKPVYQENSQGYTLKVSRSALLVTVASLLVTSKIPFIVTCFDRKPLEILSNVLLKFSTTLLLTEMGRKSGQEDQWKGGISLLWLHMIWFCDFQSLEKKKMDWFKNNQGPNTSGFLLLYFWEPTNYVQNSKLLVGCFFFVCLFFQNDPGNLMSFLGYSFWHLCLIFVTQS